MQYCKHLTPLTTIPAVLVTITLVSASCWIELGCRRLFSVVAVKYYFLWIQNCCVLWYHDLFIVLSLQLHLKLNVKYIQIKYWQCVVYIFHLFNNQWLLKKMKHLELFKLVSCFRLILILITHYVLKHNINHNCFSRTFLDCSLRILNYFGRSEAAFLEVSHNLHCVKHSLRILK